MKTVMGLYDDLEKLREVVEELLEAGIPDTSISLVAPVAGGGHLMTYRGEGGASPGKGMAAVADVASPYTIDSLSSVLPHLELCAFPGLGSVIAAGPVLAWLAQDTIGDGLLAALADWGVGPEETEFYAEGVRQGSALIAVEAPDTAAEGVVDVMDHHDPVDIDQRIALWREAGWVGYSMVLQS